MLSTILWIKRWSTTQNYLLKKMVDNTKLKTDLMVQAVYCGLQSKYRQFCWFCEDERKWKLLSRFTCLQRSVEKSTYIIALLARRFKHTGPAEQFKSWLGPKIRFHWIVVSFVYSVHASWTRIIATSFSYSKRALMTYKPLPCDYLTIF